MVGASLQNARKSSVGEVDAAVIVGNSGWYRASMQDGADDDHLNCMTVHQVLRECEYVPGQLRRVDIRVAQVVGTDVEVHDGGLTTRNDVHGSQNGLRSTVFRGLQGRATPTETAHTVIRVGEEEVIKGASVQ